MTNSNISIIRLNPIARWRRQIRNIISRYPKLYLPLARIRALPYSVVTSSTEIVIEGFPRCANSFAEAAFRLPQPRPVRLAHHCHAAAQVIAAVRWHIPTLVLFRDPDEAVRSLLMHDPHNRSARDGYREYENFYKSILPFRTGYVLASFQCITQTFDIAIRKVNNRFGTHFIEFEHTDETVMQAFNMVDQLTQNRINKSNAQYSPFLGKDHKRQREETKAIVRERLLKHEAIDARVKAQEVFETLCKSADC